MGPGSPVHGPAVAFTSDVHEAGSVLPSFKPGQTIVVEERWKGLLWSAVPQTVVEGDSARLVTYVPAGTVSVVGSNRHVPGAEHLTRSERKLEALKTLRVRPLVISETPHKLYFYTADRWTRVNLGWDPSDGRFMGWYVNFEQPVVGTAQGLAGKDLVLDMYIEPDGAWRWKDREDFEVAIDEGVLAPGLNLTFEDQAREVLRDADDQAGPFAPGWQRFQADPDWSVPALPAAFLPGGASWGSPH